MGDKNMNSDLNSVKKPTLTVALKRIDVLRVLQYFKSISAFPFYALFWSSLFDFKIIIIGVS